MTKAGFDRTFDQCRVKVKKLRGEYRKVKDGNNKTGKSGSTLKWLMIYWVQDHLQSQKY